MTETHDHVPSSTPELTDSERSLFSIDMVTTWRTRQYGIISQLRSHSSNILDTSYVDEFKDSIDTTLDEYLRDNGVDETSSNYGEIRQLFRDASIDNFTEEEWGNSPASRGVDPDDHTPEVDKFAERIAQRVGEVTTAPDAPELTDAERQARDAEFEALEAEVEEARELWATESAKRQGRFFSVDSKKRTALKQDYFAKVQALGRRHMAEHADYDDETKNLIATTIVFDEQEKLRDLTTEKLQSTKISGLIRWMNKGNTVTRIAKGVGVGAAAGLAGSFLAGAVGAGIIAGGAVAATRFARGFALKDHDKRGMDRYLEDGSGVDYRDYEVDEPTDSLNDDDRMSAFVKVADNGFEDDTTAEQKKRRKAAGYGAGMLAAGALVGYGLHEATERLADSNLTVTHWVHNQWNDFWGTPDHFPDHLPNTTDGNHHGGNHDGDHGGGDQPGNDGGVDSPAWHDFAHEARVVQPGEGGYQTLHEMGIPEAKWDSVWESAGDKLAEEGKAYRMPDGNWGWQRPMTLSNHDLGIISAAAAENGVNL